MAAASWIEPPMPATLDHDTPSVLVIPEYDPGSDPATTEEGPLGASVTTLVASALAVTLLLALILGLWWAGGPIATG